MTTQLSTKVGLCTHFSVSGNWMKQCVSCLKYYFTLSLPFEQRLVFRLCCDVQNVVSIIISTQYRSFLRFFFWHLVINGQLMSPLAIRDMVLRTLLSNLPCKLLFISSIELGLAKKLHQLSLHLIFLYLSLFLSSSISVVRCCYESSFTKITRDVRFLGKLVNTKTQTFQSGNHEGVELVLLLGYSLGSIEGCCILVLKCFYTCS